MQNLVYANIKEDSPLIAILNNKNSSFEADELDIYKSSNSCALSSAFVFVIGLKKGQEHILPLVRLLKEDHPSIPFVIVSQHFLDDVGFWCLRNRIWDYIILPSEESYFFRKIHTLLSINSTNTVRQLEFPSSATSIQTLISYTKNKTFITKNAIEYIHENFEKKITIRELVSICNLTNWQFSENFKCETGLTPREYLKAFRLNRAKCLLLETKTPVQQIAFSVGYEDPSYFCRLFKSESGETPKEFRENET